MKIIKRVFYTVGWVFLIYAFFHVLVYPGTKTGGNKYASVRPTVKQTLPYLQATRYIPPTKRPTWPPTSTPTRTLYLPTPEPFKPSATFYYQTPEPTASIPQAVASFHIPEDYALPIFNQPPRTFTPRPSSGTYILNTSTRFFHFSTCYHTAMIKPQNMRTFKGTRQEVIRMGYEPCWDCKP